MSVAPAPWSTGPESPFLSYLPEIFNNPKELSRVGAVKFFDTIEEKGVDKTASAKVNNRPTTAFRGTYV